MQKATTTTIEILETLHAAALTGSDPKPALKHLGETNPEAETLRASIEQNYSQAYAIWNVKLQGVEREDITKLTQAEADGNLADGYQTLLQDLNARSEAPKAQNPKQAEKKAPKKLSAEEIILFWKKVLAAGDINCSPVDCIRFAAQTCGNKKISKACHDIITEMEGGKSLGQALRATGYFDILTVAAAEYGEKVGKIKEVVEPMLEALKEDIKKHTRSMDWKMIGAHAATAVVLGVLLHRRK